MSPVMQGSFYVDIQDSILKLRSMINVRLCNTIIEIIDITNNFDKIFDI